MREGNPYQPQWDTLGRSGNRHKYPDILLVEETEVL
jgi:hypothetical protein